MHFAAIAVDPPSDAYAAEAYVRAELEEGSYQGDVYDWFAISGRWSGVLGGANALKFRDDPEGFEQKVDEMIAARNQTFLGIVNQIMGRRVTASDIEDDPFDSAKPHEKDAIARRITEDNKKTNLAYRKLLRSKTLRSDTKLGDGLLGFNLRRLGDLVGGVYNLDSHFVILPEYETFPTEAWWEQVRDPEGEDWWLVAVDLHS